MMLRKVGMTVLLLSFLLATKSLGQGKTVTHTFYSTQLKDSLFIEFWVQSERVLNAEAPLSLLVLWEEDALTTYAKGLIQKMQADGQIPETAVLSISGLKSSDYQKALEGMIASEPSPLTQFFKQEFLPWLNKNYPQCQYKMLAGHREKGLMTAIVMMQVPQLFDAHFCFAPTLYQLGDFEAVLRRFFIDNWHWDTDLYISIGYGDDPAMTSTLNFARLLNAHSVERPMDYKFDFVQQYTNRAVAPISLQNALNHVFEPYRMGILTPYNAPESMHALKNKLQEKYGYDPLSMELPAVSIVRKLMPLVVQAPDRIFEYFQWLVSEKEHDYLVDFTEIANFYHFLQSREGDNTIALKETEQIAAQHFGKKKIPTWQKLPNGNNYTPETAIDQGLILHFPFNQNSKNQSALNFSIKEQALEIKAEQGRNAAYFNGDDACLEIPFNENLSFTKSLSLTTWIKASRVKRFEAFIEQSVSEGNRTKWRIGFGPEAAFQLGFTTWNGAWKDYVVNYDFERNIWKHLAVVMDHTTGMVTYFIDGEPIGQVDQVFAPSFTDSPITIGGKANGDSFQGYLSDLRLYNRALSKKEVKMIAELR